MADSPLQLNFLHTVEADDVLLDAGFENLLNMDKESEASSLIPESVSSSGSHIKSKIDFDQPLTSDVVDSNPNADKSQAKETSTPQTDYTPSAPFLEAIDITQAVSNYNIWKETHKNETLNKSFTTMVEILNPSLLITCSNALMKSPDDPEVRKEWTSVMTGAIAQAMYSATFEHKKLVDSLKSLIADSASAMEIISVAQNSTIQNTTRMNHSFADMSNKFATMGSSFETNMIKLDKKVGEVTSQIDKCVPNKIDPPSQSAEKYPEQIIFFINETEFGLSFESNKIVFTGRDGEAALPALGNFVSQSIKTMKEVPQSVWKMIDGKDLTKGFKKCSVSGEWDWKIMCYS